MQRHTRRHDLIWLEAEQFDNRGGWIIDSQFVDQMGSPYLLAAGMGTPVEDAVHVASVPSPGSYRLWARTRDWAPAHHPGRFHILLQGMPAAHAFGASGRAGWHWEDGGVHRLGSTVCVALNDLTGYYGRCDAIVFAADIAWAPPESIDDIEALRRTCGGISPDVSEAAPVDVVVIGGGLAGCTAAVSAARNGARVALLHNRPILGGNASTEILVPPVGVWPHQENDPLDPRETGIIEEYRTEGQQNVREGKLYTERLTRFVTNEPNIDLHLDCHATTVDMTDGDTQHIQAVRTLDIKTGQQRRFTATFFIDCSGDSEISVKAGADYRHGKESRAMHNEPWAPDDESHHTMGNGLKYHCMDSGAPQPFDTPPWAYSFPSCDDFMPGRHPQLPCGVDIGYQWQLELGGLRDTVADAEDIRDDLLRLIFGVWDHTKNHCSRLSKEAETCRLDWIGTVAGKRENRRLLGDVILTQNNIAGQTPFPDAVAYGAWVVDDHYSEGFFHDGSFGMHMDDHQHAYQGQVFAIPFRCMYSRNVANLLMAGRNISATHLAMSDTRVMITCALMGHAAGTGAALCCHRDMLPRELAAERIDELQQRLLRDGAFIPGVRAHDPSDLAPKAMLSASSSAQHNPADPKTPDMAVNGIARAWNGRANAWLPAADSISPHWLQLEWETPVSVNLVIVAFQTANLARSRLDGPRLDRPRTHPQQQASQTRTGPA
jgi:hypothetical protein